MWTMAVDGVTAEVTDALAAAGVASILLKGPTISDWLYDDGERTYVDSDILVDPDYLAAAHATLATSGFTREWGPVAHPGMEHPPSYPWRRGHFAVDLHETLPGATADRRQVWAVLSGNSAEHAIGGRTVLGLRRPAVLLTVVLHAAHHGPRSRGPRATTGPSRPPSRIGSEPHSRSRPDSP
jgi:hypothetical protein